jgi:APA family basic amino acid/polyamine antiporter
MALKKERCKEPAFERVLGSFSATAVTIGGIIGSGIFFIIGFAAGEAGPAVILSLVLAGAIATFTALSFASLGSKIPKEGGEYQFVYIAFGPTIGFLAGLLWIFATAIGGVTASIALASYLTAVLNFGPVNVIAALVCIVFMFIDATGLRLSSKINNLLVLVKVGVLLLFIALCLPFIHGSNFNNFFSKGSGGILAATFLIFFAYAGFGKITAAAEEVKEPRKTIPKAIIAGIAISTILYIAAATASVGSVGAGILSSVEYRNAPFAHIMTYLGFDWAFSIISIGAITAAASVLLIQMLGLSRTVYAMSRNNQLPYHLCELHPTFKTPYKAEIIVGVAMALTALFVNARSVIALTSLGILSYYSLINLAALVMKRQKGGFEIHQLIPILGFVSSALLIAYYLWTVFAI